MSCCQKCSELDFFNQYLLPSWHPLLLKNNAHITDASQANFNPLTSMSDQDKDPIQAPPPKQKYQIY